MQKKFKYFIFDLDGTVAYTIEDLRTGMNLMLRDFGFKEMSANEILEAINHGMKEFVRGCLPHEHRQNEELLGKAIDVYYSYYNKVLTDTTKPYPDIIPALDYYKSKGIKMAVYSNKDDKNVKTICDKIFPDYFEITLGGNNGRFEHKPCPDGALYIARLFGAEPDDVAFVGDSDVDMHTARNAGMHPIGVSWGYRPKELLLDLGAETIIDGLEGFKKLV